MKNYEQDKTSFFHSSSYVHNTSFLGTSTAEGPLASIERERLARQLAEAIVKTANMQVIRQEYVTEFKMEVYVLSPNELAKLVREEAQKYIELNRYERF